MATPTKIVHKLPEAEDQVEVEISLGNTCNYACSYCPPSLHDGSLGWIEKEHVKAFLDTIDEQFAGRSVLIQYTGGEPTVYPGFEEILQYGKDLGFHHSIISNGSRKPRFWEKFSSYFDKVHLTFHQEQADLEHFTEIVKIASQNVLVHVNFTMIPDIYEEIYEAAQSLAHMDNVTITLKALRINFGAELYPYSDDQLDRMKKFRSLGKRSPSNHLRGMMKVIHDDGTVIEKPPSRFIVDGDNKWEGWKCWVGIQQITVKPNGDIYRGICRVGGILGNIRGEYTFPDEPVTCTREFCSCVTDIMTRKEKPEA